MGDQQPQRKLRVREAVEILRSRGFDLTERSLRADIRGKKLRATKLRNVHWIAPADLEAYIQGGENVPSDERELEDVPA